jgi:3-oxoacyl-[acyl-carrier-protein] synthase II
MASRIGIFGWGVVAPRCANIDEFERHLDSADIWLTPFNGFGPDNFLVGVPRFTLDDYRAWIDERFPPTRFSQLTSKMGFPTQYAIGAFIQALQQNPGLEQELTRLGAQAQVYVGTGVGDLWTTGEQALELDRAQREWDRFWAQPERNPAMRAYLDDPEAWCESAGENPPSDPGTVPPEEVALAQGRWWHFWAARSSALMEYLASLREIEALDVEGQVESGKRSLIRQKRVRNARLQQEWQAPEPPWNRVSANVIWNIHNTPASQISMLGRITGLSFAPVAACSTFGVTLRLAMNAIRLGQAKAVVIGATDPPPHPLVVAAFYRARVISADRQVSNPLTGLRGTHIAGGSVLWIVADYDYMTGKGFRPLGLEPLAVGVSSDADHIITPSVEGPTAAIEAALDEAGVGGDELVSWDLHATATPGDFVEVENLRRQVGESVVVTARKGTFGHGMGAGGGWELTAQYLGLVRGRLYPTPLAEGALNREIAALHRDFVFDSPCPVPQGAVGKLSMGVGGINACVISRPWKA